MVSCHSGDLHVKTASGHDPQVSVSMYGLNKFTFPGSASVIVVCGRVFLEVHKSSKKVRHFKGILLNIN